MKTTEKEAEKLTKTKRAASLKRQRDLDVCLMYRWECQWCGGYIPPDLIGSNHALSPVITASSRGRGHETHSKTLMHRRCASSNRY